MTLRSACLFALASVLVLLCGSLGQPVWDVEKEQTQRAQCELLFTYLPVRIEGAPLYLWGPREVMEYARVIDGSVRLIYGRNMWDEALNAYSYDVYSEQTRGLYLQMCSLEKTGQFLMDDEGAEAIEPQEAFAAAVDSGVNCIVLPDGLTPEVLSSIEGILGSRAVAVENYYVIIP